MRKNSLTPNKGLSLSQAQSISNLCFQRTVEIANKLLAVNNFTKIVTINGTDHTLVNGIKLPDNVIDLINEKAKLHACQAFLMENIKAKDSLLKEAKSNVLDLSVIAYPEKPNYFSPVKGTLNEVDEKFGWGQLTVSEVNEYLEAEAMASHIGQFIHKDSILDGLRNELPNIPSIDWITIEEGKKTPVTFKVHHTAEQLLDIHEKLAKLHRQYEQRVNYFKAKVKNLTTEENARISKHNADVINAANAKNETLKLAYESAMQKVNAEVEKLEAEFEITRQARIKEIVSMRIQVDPRFQDVIDKFLNDVSEGE